MRSDLLASVVVVDEGAPAATLPHLAALMPELAAHFRYYEVVYVVGEGARGAVEAAGALIATLPNLRIILASEGTGFHRRRLLGAMEAIGDVVAIYDPDELSVAQLAEEIGQAFVGRQIRIGWYQSARARDWGYRLLSLASRNVVSARAARTIILPRQGLSLVAGRKSAPIDLRFELGDGTLPYARFPIAGSPRRRPGGMGQRYELLLEILLAGAPRFLKWYALSGFVVVAGSSAYALYAVAVILLRPHVQEGWFSTALIQAGSTAFIGAGMSLLSVALVAVLEFLGGGNARMIVDELGNTDFFGRAEHFNVEVSGIEEQAE